VFPVRYELNFYINLLRNSVFKNSEPTPVEIPEVKSGRPPPIILTSTVNLIHLQKQVKSLVQQYFEFRTTRNGTKIITRDKQISMH
jgi:hypothetical protein